MRTGDRIEYGAFRLLVGAVSRLPDRWSIRLCRRLGLLAGTLGIRRRTVTGQLARVYPALAPAAVAALAREVYAHLGEAVGEVFCADPRRLAARVRVEPGWDELDAAMARGGGALLVTGHLGNFELGGRILASRYPLLDVVKPMRNRLFDRYLQDLRARSGIVTVPMDGAARPVLAHLRRGGLVTLLVDQDAGRDGLRIDFLGRPASAWSGAARLALRTGVPVLPVAIRRHAGGDHVLHLGRPLDLSGLAADEAGIRQATILISGAVESFIQACPAQWFWVHRRWKGAAEAREDDDTR